MEVGGDRRAQRVHLRDAGSSFCNLVVSCAEGPTGQGRANTEPLCSASPPSCIFHISDLQPTPER